MHRDQYLMCDVDLEEHALEHLQMKFMHYMMSGNIDKTELDIVGKFVAWCRIEMEEDISVPRGPANTSYLDRQAALKADGKISD